MTRCDRCGALTTNGRYCKKCGSDADREQRRFETTWQECPDCGGLTSGHDVSCYKCRSGRDD